MLPNAVFCDFRNQVDDLIDLMVSGLQPIDSRIFNNPIAGHKVITPTNQAQFEAEVGGLESPKLLITRDPPDLSDFPMCFVEMSQLKLGGNAPKSSTLLWLWCFERTNKQTKQPVQRFPPPKKKTQTPLWYRELSRRPHKKKKTNKQTHIHPSCPSISPSPSPLCCACNLPKFVPPLAVPLWNTTGRTCCWGPEGRTTDVSGLPLVLYGTEISAEVICLYMGLVYISLHLP